MSGNTNLRRALEKLGEAFAAREWRYLDVEPGSCWARAWAWPGAPEEDIMVCVHKGASVFEAFHRQDFFFLNYAYKGSYNAISYRYDNYITVHEGGCYVGQPYTGYALNKDGGGESIIIGVLMKKEIFYRSFLPVLSADAALLHFFLEPRTNQFSEEFIHLSFGKCSPVRALLEMMVQEYADQKEDTQDILKPLVMALLMQIARQYRLGRTQEQNLRLSDQIVRYMSEHTDAVTLKDIAKQFSYHPNYISALLHQEQGKTFSQLLLELRMERAVMLLEGTDLPIEEVAFMLGYSNSSNFYKAFREYYRCSPREYIEGLQRRNEEC